MIARDVLDKTISHIIDSFFVELYCKKIIIIMLENDYNYSEIFLNFRWEWKVNAAWSYRGDSLERSQRS
jgi:hypothetical protein